MVMQPAEFGLTKAQSGDATYLKRQFGSAIVVLCGRRYITYKLSGRDLVEITEERSVGDTRLHVGSCGLCRS